MDHPIQFSWSNSPLCRLVKFISDFNSFGLIKFSSQIESKNGIPLNRMFLILKMENKFIIKSTTKNLKVIVAYFKVIKKKKKGKEKTFLPSNNKKEAPKFLYERKEKKR